DAPPGHTCPYPPPRECFGTAGQYLDVPARVAGDGPAGRRIDGHPAPAELLVAQRKGAIATPHRRRDHGVGVDQAGRRGAGAIPGLRRLSLHVKRGREQSAAPFHSPSIFRAKDVTRASRSSGYAYSSDSPTSRATRRKSPIIRNIAVRFASTSMPA